jgi:uncharacterized peroxidase-related enzyme
MARLKTIDPASAPGKTAELLQAVKNKLGLIPNMTRVMANSPAVLQAYLSFSAALASGKLPAKLRERIALVTAEHNSCAYCLSAHTAIGKTLGLSPSELASARDAASEDARAAAALRFARAVLIRQGDVTEDELGAVRAAGYTDEEIAEIIAEVSLNVLTNFFNRAAGVEIDFPMVSPRRAAS